MAMTQEEVQLRKEQMKAVFEVLYSNEATKGLNKMLSRNKIKSAIFGDLPKLEQGKMTDEQFAVAKKEQETLKQNQFQVLHTSIQGLLKIQYIREWIQGEGKNKIYYYAVGTAGRNAYESSLETVEKPF